LLAKHIAVGNEISLALLRTTSRQFADEAERRLARRAVYEDAESKYELQSLREATVFHQISELVANRPSMLRLFEYVELKAMCRLRVSPTLADQFTAAKRRNPSFGLLEILGLAHQADQRYEWGSDSER
jgi:hypothetical protein